MSWTQQLLPLIGIGAVAVVWATVAALEIASPLLLPAPGLVADQFWKEFVTIGTIWSDISTTIGRALAAFTAASLVGTPLGLCLGLLPLLQRSSSFVLEFFRAIPPIVFLPIFMLTFGLGEVTHLVVPFYGATLIIAVNAVYGVANAGSARRLVGRLYGLTPMQVVYKIALPEAAPQIAAGMRIALSLSVILTVVVEMMVGTAGGMGKRIHDNQYLLDTPSLYVSIIVIGALGYWLNVGFVALERRIVHWVER